MQIDRKYDLYSQEFYRSAHELYASLRQEDPVFLQAGLDGKTPIWFVTRYEDVEQVLLNDKRFVLDPRLALDPDQLTAFGQQEPPEFAFLNQNLLNKDGEDHRRLRALVNKAFTPRMVQNLRPRIQQIAEELLDQVQSQGEMDLVEAYAFPLPIIVISELIGIPAADRDRFREWSNAFVTPALTPEEMQRSAQLLMAFVAYLREFFAERRQHPQDDLVSALLEVEEAGERLTESELFSMVVLLIVAGHETTVSLIGNAVVALLAHPQVRQRLQTHPEEMQAAVEELLRYDSPVDRAITRWVAEDTQLGGQQLRRGDLIIPILGSANRDESQFPQAATLELDRHPNHLAFGKGVHYCLGAPLARLEAEIAMNTLLRRMPDLELAVPVTELVWRQVPLFRSLTSIPVRW
jgi:cytochrome P450